MIILGASLGLLRHGLLTMLAACWLFQIWNRAQADSECLPQTDSLATPVKGSHNSRIRKKKKHL